MEGLYTGPPFRTRTRKHPDERPSDNRTRNQGDVTLLITGHITTTPTYEPAAPGEKGPFEQTITAALSLYVFNHP